MFNFGETNICVTASCYTFVSILAHFSSKLAQFSISHACHVTHCFQFLHIFFKTCTFFNFTCLCNFVILHFISPALSLSQSFEHIYTHCCTKEISHIQYYLHRPPTFALSRLLILSCLLLSI